MREHLSLASEHAVQRTRRHARKPLHPARDRLRARALDDEMDVIALDRDMDHAKLVAITGTQRHSSKHVPLLASTQPAYLGNNSKIDVRRMPLLVLGSRRVNRIVN
jgi:hypothetical protein